MAAQYIFDIVPFNYEQNKAGIKISRPVSVKIAG